jgi:hypothetical protein
LRECFHSQNSQNSRTSKLNTSGVKGVVWCKQKQKWRARIHADGKEFHVGFFDNIKKAEEIMLQKRARLHGVFARVD